MGYSDNGLDATPQHLDQRTRTGEVIRAFREQQGLSVRTLAKMAGFSPSFISQVEHGLASPSIASMEKIAHALGVSLGEFFATESRNSEAPFIVRAGEGQKLTSEWSQATLHALSPSWEDRILSPILMTLAPGGRTGAKPAGHRGEEFALVLSGTVQLHLESERRELVAGDSIHLVQETPHQWENTSTRQVRILLVST